MCHNSDRSAIKIIGTKHRETANDIAIVQKCLKRACAADEARFHMKTPRFWLWLCYTRKDYDKEVKRRTRRWESAVANKRRVMIFAPSVYTKLTNNTMSFDEAVMHEVNHVFYMNFIGANTPQWLLEGIATLVDGSDRTHNWKGRPKMDRLYFSSKETNRKGKSDADIAGFYRSAHLATIGITRKIGMNGLISLLKTYSKNPKKATYLKLFAQFITN